MTGASPDESTPVIITATLTAVDILKIKQVVLRKRAYQMPGCYSVMQA